MKKETLNLVLKAQKNEITEHIIYNKLSKKCKDKNNRIVLKHMSVDELDHYKHWKKISKKDVSPDNLSIFFYTLLSNIFGLSFGLKLMARRKKVSSDLYKKLRKNYKAVKIIKDEQKHEKNILSLLSEERVVYAGSLVLGLNDAIVELTGALAGLTFALQNTFLVAIIGLITGIAASLSMATSSYLETREDEHKNPIKSAIYTGIAYFITVLFLVLPHFLISNYIFALITMLAVVILIIAGYTFFISIAKDLNFSKEFSVMTMISITVAFIGFLVGYLLRILFGIEIN